MKKGWMWCILTSKWVLHMPFAGRNNFFGAKTSFSFFFHHQQKKCFLMFWAFLFFFSFFHLWWRKMVKLVLTMKQMVFTSESCVEYPLVDRNTQQSENWTIWKPGKLGTIWRLIIIQFYTFDIKLLNVMTSRKNKKCLW